MKNKYLFLKGNRSKIYASNIKELYEKMKLFGYLKSMPIKILSMALILKKYNEYELYEVEILNKKEGNEALSISNYELRWKLVDKSEYPDYEGVVIDGQHRLIAAMIDPQILGSLSVTFVEIEDCVNLLQYIALINDGKPWNIDDFACSKLLTNNKFVDHIFSRIDKSLKLNTLLPIYTLGVRDINAKEIKLMQQIAGFGSEKTLPLSIETQNNGDLIYDLLKKHEFLSIYELTAKFTIAIKKFYKEIGCDINYLIIVLNNISKSVWEKYFVPETGRSLEVKGYKDALINLKNDLDNNQNIEIKD